MLTAIWGGCEKRGATHHPSLLAKPAPGLVPGVPAIQGGMLGVGGSGWARPVAPERVALDHRDKPGDDAEGGGAA